VTTFSLTWYDKNGVQKGTMNNLTIQPWEIRLINDVFTQFGAVPAEGMSIKVSADVAVYAYASIVRNDTGDAFTIIGNGPFD
jgi:hypothetical protein